MDLDVRQWVKLSLEIDGKLFTEKMIVPSLVPHTITKWKQLYALKNKNYKMFVTIGSTMQERPKRQRFKFFNKINTQSNETENTTATCENALETAG